MIDKQLFDGVNNFLNIDYIFENPITYNGNKYNNLKDAMNKTQLDNSDTWENWRRWS